MKNKKKILNIILVVIVSILIVYITIKVTPFLISLKNETNRIKFKNYVNSLGFWGILLMLGLQILQVVVAFIPGEPVEILSGMMYGVWGGLLLCLVGIFIATWISFVLTKALGKPLIATKKDQETIDKYKFIKNERKVEKIFFFLFFIPATPKDLFNYVAPFTKIKLHRYLLISTFARIPSIISSTYIGSTLATGNYLISLAIFGVVGIFGFIGLYLNGIYIKKSSKEEIENKNEISIT